MQRPVCISVINMKGGVGKTTIAARLSQHASRRLDVLAVDMDPQANLSQSLMEDEDYRRFLNANSPSIVEVFKGFNSPTSDMPSPRPLDPASIAIDLRRRLSIIPSRFDFSDNLIESVKPDPQRLARMISEQFQDKDIIIVDCTPTESIFTQAAYHASRYLLVPVKPEFLATIGFPLLSKSLEKFRTANPNHCIEVVGIVINNGVYHYSGNRGGPERDRAMAEIRAESEKNAWHIFEHQIPFSRGFPKMMRGDFSYPGDATLFDFFAEELLQKLGFEP